MEYDRYCDLTMRGGTTSGVVYPLAVASLARHYEFKQIGGASAGAIAAGFTAAAERGRASGGFEKLAGLIDWFTSGSGAERWRMAQLFQPAEKTRALYRIVIASMQKRETTGRSAISCLFFALLGAVGLRAKSVLALMALLWLGGPVLFSAWLAPSAYPGWIAALVAVLALACLVMVLWPLRSSLPWPAWVFAAVPLVLGLAFSRHYATAAIVLLVWLVLSLAAVSALIVTYGYAMQRFLKANATSIHFGLVPGTGDFTPSWLDRLAGVPKSTGVPPLADWIADRLDDLAGTSDAVTFGDLGDINLVLMTTDLSEGRPYRLPFKEEWQYCEECLGYVLPQRVVEQLNGRETDAKCPLHGYTPLRELPPRDQLPVVLAVRMSLSFPGLIAAVPLCRDGRVHWFSDGGITSNFPIHFFDALLPRWPTFGLTIQPYPNGDKTDVWLPEQDASASGTPYSSIGSVPRFLVSILDTFLDWRDTMQSALPGYRGRIAHVRQSDDEGGSNLFMPPATIKRLALRGQQAGDMLRERFQQQRNTDRYRWIRLRMALREYKELGEQAADRDALYEELLRRFEIPAELHDWFRTPPADGDPFRDGIEVALDHVGRLKDDGPFDGVPPVDPDLRLTPPE
ncbi:patatin-like phospholipase family protein [Lentzea sp. BCCO 10_0061]|uniref:Patatin-like phospholipase family protein n=1 Tax=Lentzea sokolovensis TaxID=3095429 RepID=A0ABU4V0Q6_9PSEU|nr:patatin-like phospholipase family protein [Lentzea sp. BCCO 10_0061]MDX8145348.1 patatin-like phospholipase family protein [Lentzea sp. BCCO 10_0061]